MRNNRLPQAKENPTSSMAEMWKRRCINLNDPLSTEINVLPLEIILDILARLPVESIFTCKLVCKSWYGMIRDPYFVGLHLRRSESGFILETVHWGGHIFNVDNLPFVDIERSITKQIPIERVPWRDFHIMSSCNGLICIKAWDGKPDPLCICNPITNENIILPSSSERLLSSYVVGLGFDSSTGKYKVVRKRGGGKRVGKLEIISLGETSWRELNVPMLDWQGIKVVFHNEVFYCQLMKRISKNNWSVKFLAVDVKDEKSRVISFPVNFRSQNCVEIVDLNGSLAIVEHCENIMKVWSLTGNIVGDFNASLEEPHDTKSRWTTKFYYKTIGKVKNNYLLWVTTLKHVLNDQFAVFSPETSEMTALNIRDIPERFNAVDFKPSFVSPLAAALHRN